MAVFLAIALFMLLVLSVVAMRVRSGVKLFTPEQLIADKVPFDSKALQWLGWPTFIATVVVAAFLILRLPPAVALLSLGAVMIALFLEVKRARNGRADGDKDAGYVLGHDLLDKNAWYARYVRTTEKRIPFLVIAGVFLFPWMWQADVAALVIYLVWAHLDLLERKPNEQQSSAN